MIDMSTVKTVSGYLLFILLAGGWGIIIYGFVKLIITLMKNDSEVK